MALISSIVYLSIPLGAIAFFVVSLVLFCTAVNKNKQIPNLFSRGQMLTRKILLIVSSVIMGEILLIVLAIIALTSLPIAFM